MVTQLVKKLSAFCEILISLCSQEPDTDPYPEPDESSQTQKMV
jgi:hypothetical protein